MHQPIQQTDRAVGQHENRTANAEAGPVHLQWDAWQVLKRLQTQASANSVLAPNDFPAPGDGEQVQQLTKREVDVLRLIAKGYKVSDTARMLRLSAHTVSSYIREIYRKLDISSRAEATMEAARRGLVR